MRLQEETLESMIKDKDIEKAESTSMMKAAEDSEEFRRHMMSGGSHGITFVKVGNEMFDSEGEREVSRENLEGDLGGKEKKYESINTMEFGCKCGQTHPFNPAHSEQNSNPFADSGYSANLSGKDSAIKTGYSPGSEDNTGGVRYLSEQGSAKGVQTPYLQGSSDESEDSDYSSKFGVKKKKS